MVINNLQEYDAIWDWIYEKIHFHPYGLDEGHDLPYGPPFRIPVTHTVYGIEQMTDAQLGIMDELIRRALLNVTENT